MAAQKFKNVQIEAINGTTCVIFVGERDSFYIPAAGLQTVFDEALKHYHAFESQRGAKAGQWSFASRILTPQSWRTGTTDNGKIAVTVDHGLPTEQTFALSADHAAELGQQLLDRAANPPTPPKRQ